MILSGIVINISILINNSRHGDKNTNSFVQVGMKEIEEAYQTIFFTSQH